MSTNCNIYLPPGVDGQAIAEVAGVLWGLPVRREHLPGGGLATFVDGVHMMSVTDTPIFHLSWTAAPPAHLADGDPDHWCTLHPYSRRPSRAAQCLSPNSTAAWIAVGRRLVCFFGGALQFRDTDPDDVLHVTRAQAQAPYDAAGLVPEDGEPWQAWQDAVAALKPVTKRDIEDERGNAAYK